MEAVARPAATCCPQKLSSCASGAIWLACLARSPITSTAAWDTNIISLELALRPLTHRVQASLAVNLKP